MNSKKRIIHISSAFVLGAFSYWLSDFSLGQQASVVVGITAAVTYLWITETLPLFVSALAASFCLIFVADFSAKEIFIPYFDPVIVLFLGGFLLARAMQKHGLDQQIAYNVLHRMSSRTPLVILALMSITAFLSLWMSNTASAALMIPIALSVLEANGILDEDGRILSDKGLAKAVVLGVAYAATLGGIGSLVGSPPNAFAYRFLQDKGISLSFFDWMLKTLPFVVLAIILAWGVLLLMCKSKTPQLIFHKVPSKITFEQKKVLVLFALALLGWLTSQWTGISSSLVAVALIVLLFATSALEENDIRKISWETLLLFGGGLSLGQALNKVKVDLVLAEFIKDHFTQLHPSLFILMLVLFSILATMIISNTAAAALLIPLVIPLGEAMNLPGKEVAILLAVGVSLDFMMPVGTPPSAIAYSTGHLKVKEMIRIGFLVNLGTALLLTLFFI